MPPMQDKFSALTFAPKAREAALAVGRFVCSPLFLLSSYPPILLSHSPLSTFPFPLLATPQLLSSLISDAGSHCVRAYDTIAQQALFAEKYRFDGAHGAAVRNVEMYFRLVTANTISFVE